MLSTGDRARPARNSPPRIARARVVEEQYSLLDLGQGEIETRKVIGASFGLNRALLGDQAYFDETLGRRGGKLPRL